MNSFVFCNRVILVMVDQQACEQACGDSGEENFLRQQEDENLRGTRLIYPILIWVTLDIANTKKTLIIMLHCQKSTAVLHIIRYIFYIKSILLKSSTFKFRYVCGYSYPKRCRGPSCQQQSNISFTVSRGVSEGH